MDQLAKQQACQLFIEQEIEKGLAAGKTTYSIGKDVAQWIEKLFVAKVRPDTIKHRAQFIKDNLGRNLPTDSTPENQREIEEKQVETGEILRGEHGRFAEGTPMAAGPGRPPKFTVTPAGGDWYQSSESPEWETPQWLFDLLNEEFGFEIDVCASEKNHKCQKYFSKIDDGLRQKWEGTCWMNPPYGRELPQWISKAKSESQKGILIVCLVPARTDTEWWWNNCIQGEIRFIKGRLKFSDQAGAPMASAVVILKQKNEPKVIWWDIKSKE